jgi:hypothetical protein
MSTYDEYDPRREEESIDSKIDRVLQNLRNIPNDGDSDDGPRTGGKSRRRRRKSAKKGGSKAKKSGKKASRVKRRKTTKKKKSGRRSRSRTAKGGGIEYI